MSTKLKVVKGSHINPITKQMGFSARVQNNGKAGFEEIVTSACRNTTLHKAEAKIALELCMETVAEMLKQGMIVDLGPLGKLYPSCSSGWFANADEMKLSDVKPGLYYRPADEISAAIKGASLTWANDADEDLIPEEEGQ